MYIFKNALRSISRSKGRNILIGIIALVIATSACVALSIKEAANQARKSSLDLLNITAQISVNRQSLMKNTASSNGQKPDMSSMRSALQGMTGLSLDQMLTYAGVPSVKDFYYTLTTSLNADSNTALNAVDTSSSDTSSTANQSQSQNQQQMPNGGEGGRSFNMAGGMGQQGDFTVVGYSSENAMTNFINGTSTITSGTIFDENTTDMVCIISDELALYNSLNVNDTISLVNPNNEAEVVQLTIVGIYNNSNSAVSEGGRMGGFSASSDPANQIYTSYNTLKSVTSASSANATTQTNAQTGTEQTTAMREQIAGTYVFADVASYEAFEGQARELGLEDTYTINSSDITSYEQSLQPLENLSKFATYFLLIVLLIGGIILVVLNIFNIRDRKYEIGVLTAIGMKKGKVVLQFITELFIVTFLAIIIGAGIGTAASVPTTNALLASQITSQQQQRTSQQNNFGRMPQMTSNTPSSGGSFGAFSNTNYISQVSSATDLNVILQLIGIGILLTMAASCSAVTFVLRYEPLKILTNRD